MASASSKALEAERTIVWVDSLLPYPGARRDGLTPGSTGLVPWIQPVVLPLSSPGLSSEEPVWRAARPERVLSLREQRSVQREREER
jgi:hypothetical protein